MTTAIQITRLRVVFTDGAERVVAAPRPDVAETMRAELAARSDVASAVVLTPEEQPRTDELQAGQVVLLGWPVRKLRRTIASVTPYPRGWCGIPEQMYRVEYAEGATPEWSEASSAGADERWTLAEVSDDSHTGRPVVRSVPGAVLILCPAGHLVQSIPSAGWAHSTAEARVSDPAYTVTCRGTLAGGEQR